MIKEGIKGTMTETVTEEKTAAAVGSGLLPVYGTPMMIALIENTACQSVVPFLEEGEGTVGTNLNINHTAATPLGMEVRCETTLVTVDRRRLVFDVKVYDEAGEIGNGTHERFIIRNESFMEKVLAKNEK